MFLNGFSEIEIFLLDNSVATKKTTIIPKTLLPGTWQGPITHIRPSVKFLLSQPCPPCAGGGLEQFRWRSWNPVPHGTLQFVQLDHSEKPPSTVKTKKNKFLWISVIWQGLWKNWDFLFFQWRDINVNLLLRHSCWAKITTIITISKTTT